MGASGSGTVAVYDDAVERPNTATSISGLGNSLLWKSDGSTLYAAYTAINDSGFFQSVSDNALFAMPVSSTGVGAVTSSPSTFRAEGPRLHLDPNSNYVYDDYGEVVNASSGVPVGDYYSWPSLGYFPGPLSVIDPALGFYYTLAQVQGPDGKTAARSRFLIKTIFNFCRR